MKKMLNKSVLNKSRIVALYMALSSVLVSGLTMGAPALAAGGVSLTSSALVEVVSKDAAGKETKTIKKAEKAVPGQEVMFKNELHNGGTQKAGNLVLNNPVPENMVLVEASGNDADILYSADGKTFAADGKVMVVDGDTKLPRVARKEEYKSIRWVLKNSLDAGQSVEVGFKAMVK